MIKPAVPENEQERLKSLMELNILDTPPEKDFDQITALANQICQTPISLITLLDGQRQWFKSHCGTKLRESTREMAFCSHAILNPHELTLVQDANDDERFADNPLIAGDPNVVFYAGAPLVSKNGYAWGTLCVIDHHRRDLENGQQMALKILSRQVVKLLELRKAVIMLEEYQTKLEHANERLKYYAQVVSHDLKNPLTKIVLANDLVRSECEGQNNSEILALNKVIKDNSQRMHNMIDGIYEYASHTSQIDLETEQFGLMPCLQEVVAMLNVPPNIKFKINASEIQLYSHKGAVQQILLNLIANAIKYNTSQEPEIVVSVKHHNGIIMISVEDNGPGIPLNEQEKIFSIFHTANQKDRFGNQGTGIGLATVKELVSTLGGEIKVDSELGKGSLFVVTIPGGISELKPELT